MNLKEEGIVFLIQLVFLLVFSFVLQDLLAALIVSFFSRPLTKRAIQWVNHNLEKRRD